MLSIAARFRSSSVGPTCKSPPLELAPDVREKSSRIRERETFPAVAALAPDHAWIIVAGSERLVPVADVAVGACVLVWPGERLPLDGVVESGTSSVDESPINGGSVPAPATARGS
jgi:cation transport ATPase